MRGSDADEVYTNIVADIAKLSRHLAKVESYKSANGSTALLAFADHLEGIVEAVGVQPSMAVDTPPFLQLTK